MELPGLTWWLQDALGETKAQQGRSEMLRGIDSLDPAQPPSALWQRWEGSKEAGLWTLHPDRGKKSREVALETAHLGLAHLLAKQQCLPWHLQGAEQNYHLSLSFPALNPNRRGQRRVFCYTYKFLVTLWILWFSPGHGLKQSSDK